MSQYKAVYLEKDNKKFVIGDDIFLDFVIVNEKGEVLTSLTGWTFEAELYNDLTECEMTDESGESYFTISGGLITLHLLSGDTTELDSLPYTLEIQGTLSGNIYTILQMEVEFVDEEIT